MWSWVLTIVALVSVLYWYLRKVHGYWEAKGVHTLPGALPFLGHMTDAFLFKKSPSWLHCEMYSEAKGQPAVGVYSFRQPALLVRNLNLIQKVLISDFTSFHDNIIELDETLEPHMSKNPFTLRGQKWKTLRQQLTPAFSPGRIKTMYPLIQRVCQEFNSYMEKRLNEDIHVNHVTGIFASEIVARCAFGVDGNAFNDPNAEFYQQGRKIWDSNVNNPLMQIIFFFFPAINKYFLKKSFIPQDTTDFFVSLVEQAVDYRSKNPDKVPDNDYLQFLLSLRDKNKDFTLHDVVSQGFTFFVDGFETSSMTASFALYELTMHPEIQEALRHEVNNLESFNYEGINSLPLLDRVIQETLRKYSVLSFTRECVRDTVLEAEGQSFYVSKGDQVIVPAYAVHHDPDIYPEPEKFDPDRFLPENIKNRHPLSFMGFGAGPRICIAYRFATTLVKVLITNIIANFQVIKCEKTEDDMKFSKKKLMPEAVNGIWVRFQKL